MGKEKRRGKCDGCGNSPRVLTKIMSGQCVCVTCLREIRGPRTPKRLAKPNQIARLREKGYAVPDDLTAKECYRLQTMIVLRERGIPFDPSATIKVLETQRFMNQPPTGRQRDWALALGFSFSDKTTHAEMAAMLDQVGEPPYAIGEGVPTAVQRRLAAEWQLTIPDAATRYDAAGVLFGFLVARAWVYFDCIWDEKRLNQISCNKLAMLASDALGSAHYGNGGDASSRVSRRIPNVTPDTGKHGKNHALCSTMTLLQPLKGVTVVRYRIQSNYSVCRHIAEAGWRLHSESGLPVKVVNWMARAVSENPEVFVAIRKKKSSSPSTCDAWDAWFYIGEQTTDTEEYRFAAALARQHLSRYLVQQSPSIPRV